MSLMVSPASAIAFSAASACSWICDVSGMTPSLVVSAAPTTATWFLRMLLALRRYEQGECGLVVDLLELDLHLHVELQRLGRLRAVDNIGHHARTFLEFDDGNRVGRCEARHRTVMDDVAVKETLAARLEYRHLAVSAFGTERA